MRIEKKLIKVGNSVALIIPDIWITAHPEYNTKGKSVMVDLRDNGTIYIELKKEPVRVG
jgi:antitoxin component of MazEF toxin-antitoxin module